MKKTFIIRNVLLIFFLLSIGKIMAQENSGIRIQGTVTDEEGLPMPGVTITLRSAGQMASIATANNSGNYSISAQSESDTLIFSFIGYDSQSHIVGNSKTLNVMLLPTPALLDEVVVTGYQTISRERATGSFAKVSAETLETQRLSSLGSILEGQVAGFTGGLLRGTTSMNGMTNPLYVIDGFPVENTRFNLNNGNTLESLPDLNLEDIESITVLKDAAATSIYGARAANGVVVIVTKKAAKGKPHVSLSSTFTFTPYSINKDRLTNAADIVELEKEWAANNPNLQGAGAASYAQNLRNNMIYTNQGILAILDYHRGASTQQQLDSKLNELASQGYRYYDDVEEYAKRNQFYQQHNLSIGHATDNNMFRASLTYRDNKYADVNSKDNSLGINITNSLTLTKWLKLDVGTYNNYKKATTQTYDPLSPGYKYLPYDGLVNADGSYYTSTAESRLSTNTLNTLNTYDMYSMNITPLDEINMNLSKTKTFSNRTFGKVEIKFVDWLSYNAMFQYEYTKEDYTLLQDKNSYTVRNRVNSLASYTAANGFSYDLPYGHIYNASAYTNNAYNFRQQLNFNKTFADKHNVTAIAGQEVRHAKMEYNNRTLYNYDPAMLSFEMINEKVLTAGSGRLLGGSFASRNVSYQYERQDRFVSFYGNAAYTYDSKYMVTGSLRWDRSNLWGTNSKYQNKPIWSVGAGWNIDREDFFDVSWVDRLKLRFSHGIGGNISKNNAPYMTAYYYSNTNVGGIYGNISSRPNPLLSWEKTTTTNIGVDFSMLKNRLNGSVDYYNKKGEDLLASTMGVPTEGWGYSTYTINNGEMRNRGIEVSLNGEIIKTKDFRWSAAVVYGYNKNKVTYVNVEAPVYYLQIDYSDAYPRIGNPYNAIYGYKWAGLSSTGLPQVYDADGNAVSATPTNLEDIVYCGTTVPTHSGSVRFSFNYKSFELSALAIFEAGHKMRNTDLAYLGNTYTSMGYITNIAAANKDIVNRWRQPGDENHTDIPAAIFAEMPGFSSSLHTLYQNADINVLNASNLRLSNISLSYVLPAHITSKAYMQNVRVQFNVENLFTIAANKTAKNLIRDQYGYYKPSYVIGLHINF